MERVLPCPSADADAILAEPRTYPLWLVGARKIRYVSPSWPRRGSYFEHVVGFGPVASVDRTTSKGFRRGRELNFVVRARPFLEALVRFEVAPGAEGCCVRMTETPMGLFNIGAPVVHPLIAVRNERSLQRLESLLCADRTPIRDVTSAKVYIPCRWP